MNKTFEYFSILNTIPRPSGKEEKMRDYLIDFAKSHNLKYTFDKTHNVIIYKPTNCNRSETLILQAHTDMVCEKLGGVDIDFDTMPIKTIIDGDFIKACGTTLGADNGVGLSMILSILSDDSLKIPNIEAVFTAQEETTMQGAFDLNFNLLKGGHLLSIDGTDEGKLEVSSAGMVVSEYSKVLSFEKPSKDQKFFEIELSGFRGGHSGTEISTDRQNAIKVFFEFLSSLSCVKLVSLNGGGKSNAIARECKATICSNVETLESITEKSKEFLTPVLKTESFAKIEVTALDVVPEKVVIDKDTTDIISFVSNHKNGVLVWSKNNVDFPLTSNNFANIKIDGDKIVALISLRSSVVEYEKTYLKNLSALAEKYNMKEQILSTAPFFERKQNSYLQTLCSKTYNQLYGTPAIVNGVHAGLEGGVFASKRPDLDICVIAPNIYDAHSPEERVSISSIKRVYSWLEKIVENF